MASISLTRTSSTPALMLREEDGGQRALRTPSLSAEQPPSLLCSLRRLVSCHLEELQCQPLPKDDDVDSEEGESVQEVELRDEVSHVDVDEEDDEDEDWQEEQEEDHHGDHSEAVLASTPFAAEHQELVEEQSELERQVFEDEEEEQAEEVLASPPSVIAVPAVLPVQPELAAVKLQGWWRRMLAQRIRFEEVVEDIMMGRSEAALCIQRHWRGVLGRREAKFEELVQEMMCLRDEAASDLQRWWRSLRVQRADPAARQ